MTTPKLSPWSAKRQGTLNKFYTREDVGDLLMRELGDIAPQSMIDLGAGEGSLAAAALRRWPDASVLTVDIDPSCVDRLHAVLLASGTSEHEHRTLDALSSDLPEQLGNRRYDLAVCNPPFYRPHWQRAFADVLRDADLSEACNSTVEASAEILFLAQNLRMLEPGGTVAMIVPDGLATAWRATAFRKALVTKHTLRTVIQLPPYSFLDTEAYCFILVITKGCDSEYRPIKLIKLEEEGSLSPPLLVERAEAENRLDYTYHALAKSYPSGATTLRNLGADVRRGSLSTVDRKSLGKFVFHTGDFPIDFAAVSLDSDVPDIGKPIVVAEEGDILLARVDRELHDKITLVSSGRAAITDCVYRIRLPKRHQKSVFEALSSQTGRTLIQAATKGVGARLIGKGDLLDLPIVIKHHAA